LDNPCNGNKQAEGKLPNLMIAMRVTTNLFLSPSSSVLGAFGAKWPVPLAPCARQWLSVSLNIHSAVIKIDFDISLGSDGGGLGFRFHSWDTKRNASDVFFFIFMNELKRWNRQRNRSSMSLCLLLLLFVVVMKCGCRFIQVSYYSQPAGATTATSQATSKQSRIQKISIHIKSTNGSSFIAAAFAHAATDAADDSQIVAPSTQIRLEISRSNGGRCVLAGWLEFITHTFDDISARLFMRGHLVYGSCGGRSSDLGKFIGFWFFFRVCGSGSVKEKQTTRKSFYSKLK